MTFIKDKEKYMKTGVPFFEKLFGNALEKGCGKIEIRNFVGVQPTQSFFTDPIIAAEFAYNMCNLGIDIYQGVNLRVGDKGTKANIHHVSAFHAEVDYGEDGHKKIPEYKDYNEACEAIANFHMPPTLITVSGGGLHCFWVLTNPVKVFDVGVAELESINKYLLQSLKADPGTQNIDRVLRPPGTYNFKLGTDKPRLVNVFQSNGPYYNFDDFKQYINVEEKKKKSKPSPKATVNASVSKNQDNKKPIRWDNDISSLNISDKMKNLILNGNDGTYTSRSEADSAVITALINNGYQKTQITEIFETYPIGEKYKDHPSPEQYLDLTIEKAKKHSNLTEEEMQNPLFISGSINKSDNDKYSLKVVNYQEYISKKYKLKFFEDEKAFFKYGQYCYEHLSDERLNHLCQTELGKFRKFFSQGALKEFQHFSKGQCLVNSAEQYKHQKRYLTMQNGLYDLDMHELIPHDSKIFTTNPLPYKYDPEAKCPLWLKFLDDVFMGKQDIIEFVHQAVGYAFYKDIPTAALFLLVGEGANGKSTFINTTSNLFGEDNIATINLHQFSDEKYILDLFGKMINLSGESSRRKKIDTELIKAAVAGDYVIGRTPYKEPTKFRPYAKHFLSVNEIPKNDDLSYGWQRRIFPIEFNRTFTEEDADVHMTNKLKDELPGIFNWAIQGYRNLCSRNFAFMKSDSIAKAKENYMNQSNSVFSFISDHLSKADDENILPFKELYEMYKESCLSEGDKNFLNKADFKGVLRKSGYKVDNSTKHGNKVMVFGVKYRN